MKVVIIFNNSIDYACPKRTIGFETHSIESLEMAIREIAFRYQNDLPEIEKKIIEIYNNDNLTDEEQDQEAESLRYEPYLIRCGKYKLWVGEFIVFNFNDGDIVNEFIMPDIMTLDQWFDTVSEIGVTLH